MCPSHAPLLLLAVAQQLHHSFIQQATSCYQLCLLGPFNLPSKLPLLPALPHSR